MGLVSRIVRTSGKREARQEVQTVMKVVITFVQNTMLEVGMECDVLPVVIARLRAGWYGQELSTVCFVDENELSTLALAAISAHVCCWGGGE